MLVFCIFNEMLCRVALNRPYHFVWLSLCRGEKLHDISDYLLTPKHNRAGMTMYGSPCKLNHFHFINKTVLSIKLCTIESLKITIYLITAAANGS